MEGFCSPDSGIGTAKAFPDRFNWLCEHPSSEAERSLEQALEELAGKFCEYTAVEAARHKTKKKANSRFFITTHILRDSIGVRKHCSPRLITIQLRGVGSKWAQE